MRVFSGSRLRKSALLSILALVLVSSLAACGVSGGKGSTAPSGTTGASANSGGCGNNLTVFLVRSDQVAGHVRYLMVFSNQGSSPCTLEGYPVVKIPNSAITVNTTSTADTWSNVAIAPVTLAPSSQAPGGGAWFALQGRDETTNCQMVTPSIAPSQGAQDSSTDAVITICGGKLFVSPMVANPQAFNK